MTNPPDTSVTERVARAIKVGSLSIERDARIDSLTDEEFQRLARAAISSMPSLEEENAALREALSAWREVAQFDATMEGPVFKGWNRSALNRALKVDAALSPRKEDQQTAWEDRCRDCDDTGITIQTERRCACQPALKEGASREG